MKHLKKKKRIVIACNQVKRKISDPSNAEEYYNSFLKRKTQNQ